MNPLLSRLARASRSAGSAVSSAVTAWIVPPRCAACELPTATPGTQAPPLCEACAATLVENLHACPRCAEPYGDVPCVEPGEGSTVANPGIPDCPQCFRLPPPQSGCHAPFEYGGQLAVVLRMLKHNRRRDLARTIAPLFSAGLATAAARCGADVIVPVPLGYWRMAARGFNQSATLARFASENLNVPIEPRALLRVRSTVAQAGLSRRARERNVAGAFAIAPRHHHRVANRRVLVFDDIMTTGATVREAARVLLAAGAAAVEVFACARATSLR